MTTEPLQVLSLGGGIQSSALLLMSVTGMLPHLDAVVFADTQHEMPGTYAYLRDVLQPAAEAAGTAFYTVTAGDLKAEVIARTGKGSQPMLPVRVRTTPTAEPGRIGAYTCSFNFKREVVTRQVKQLIGGRGAWKRAGAVDQWIGYSTDEASRIKPAEQCWCGHNRTVRTTKAQRTADPELAKVELIHRAGVGCARCACTEFAPWQRNRWPLIDLQLSRSQVRRWFAANGYPEPPRSACYFCPNRGDAHWRDLRANHPELWAQAVELDAHVRHGMNGLRGTAFLHRTGLPLTEVDIRPRHEQLADQGIMPLFTDEDADCDAGTCFT